ncbi:hypothetical protein BDP67DRAFT_485046 [Colletotrichum lupini]|nr:hypothetical protein BDP67DRAFT_485046 [Colletotrichum lupini]
MASERYYHAPENPLIQHHSWAHADHTLSIPSQNGTVFSETPLQSGNYAEGYLPATLEASSNHMLLSNANFESDIGTLGLSDLNVNAFDHVTAIIGPQHHEHPYAWGSSEMIPQEVEMDYSAFMMLDDSSEINVGLHDSSGSTTIHEQSSASDAITLFPKLWYLSLEH